MRFLVYDTVSGQVTAVGECQPENLLAQASMPWQQAITSDTPWPSGDPNQLQVDVVTGEVRLKE